MLAIINASFERSKTVLLALVTILVAGTIAYLTIPKESEPDITIPTMYVSISHHGISPEDAERLLVKPMEERLKSLTGLKELRAVAATGHASIVLEFEAGIDPDEALDDVRNEVDIAKAELPDETNEPTVHEINLALFPILSVMLYGDMPERSLVKIAQDLQDQLEALPDVLEAKITGDREEQIEIEIDPLYLEGYGISINEVFNLVASNNQLVAAGAMDTGSGRYSLKVPGVIKDLPTLLGLAIKVDGQQIVTLGDVATVRRSFVDPSSFARLDGKPTLVLEVSKRLGSNIIETVDSVRAVVAERRQYWPENAKVAFSQDKSKNVKEMLNDLQNNVLSGIILVMIVVVAVLGLRAGSLVGVSIPGSFLLGILVLQAMGLTVNMVVLFSLIMALGLLVDAAIVVVELADRNIHQGMERVDAYANAARRMAWPILASTATTLAAFAPLLFWPGIWGEFMRYLPITLIAVLSASFVMAMIFVPNMGAVFGRKTLVAQAVETAKEGALVKAYTRLVSGAIRFPLLVLLSTVLLMAGSCVGYGKFGKGVQFTPDVEPEAALVYLHARGQLSIYERDTLLRELEARVLPIEGFDSVYSKAAMDLGNQVPDGVVGTLQLDLKDWDKRRKWRDIEAEVRERTAGLPGVIIEIQKQKNGPDEGKPIQIEVASTDETARVETVELIRRGMREIGGLTDIGDTRPSVGLEWRLEVDRAAASRYGVSVASIGQSVQLLTHGIKLSEYRPDDSNDELEIRARYPRDKRNVGQLDKLRIQTPQGLVPISLFVKRVPARKVDTIKRTDSQRVYTVDANLAEGALADAKLKELQAWMQQQAISPLVKIKAKGENEEQAETMAFLGKAFLVALAVIAAILVTQFNSFYESFLILSSVIFSTIGVMLGLIITQQPFGVIMSGIGVIALAGIVVNNNIVLIDTFNTLKKQGLAVTDAVIETGRQRLRPVLLTTATTVLGLMPMALKMNVDLFNRTISFGAPSTQWWAQLAIAIVGGLLFATVLTLVVTPTLLALPHVLRERRAARKARRLERKMGKAVL